MVLTFNTEGFLENIYSKDLEEVDFVLNTCQNRESSIPDVWFNKSLMVTGLSSLQGLSKVMLGKIL